jgi:hypothetical protein
MSNTFRIKRRAVGGAAGAPPSLAAAELAFNEQDNTLYYGKGNSGGLATSIIPVVVAGAGVGSYLPLTGGTLTGPLNITDTTPSSSPTTGALKVAGGLGVSGNIYSGNIGISKADPVLELNKSGSGQGCYIYAKTAGVTRWYMTLGDSDPEVGSAGSKFGIHRCDNAGAYLDTPIYIPRDTGVVQLSTAKVSSTVAATSKTTGALTVGGGLGVGGDIYCGANISTGHGSTIGSSIELGAGITTNGYSYVDFITTPGADFNFRVLRNPGPNGNAEISNTGTGAITFGTSGAQRALINSSGWFGIGPMTGPSMLFDVMCATNRHVGIRDLGSIAQLCGFNDGATAYVALQIDAQPLYLNSSGFAVNVGGSLNFPYTGSSPASGPGIRWTAGTYDNMLGLYVSAGLVFQGNAPNQDFKVHAVTTDGSLGAMRISLNGAGSIFCLGSRVKLDYWNADGNYAAICFNNDLTNAGMTGVFGGQTSVDPNLYLTAPAGRTIQCRIAGNAITNITSGGMTIEAATGSTNKTTGTLVVRGGMGVDGAIFCDDIHTSRASAPSTGVVYFGSGDTYLYFDGTNFNLNGGSYINITAQIRSYAGYIRSSAQAGGNAHFEMSDEGGGSRGYIYWERSTNTVRVLHAQGGDAVQLNSAGVIALSNGYAGRAGRGGAYDGNTHNFYWNGTGNRMWVDDSDFGSVQSVCDYRTKKDVAPLPSTWNAVKALRPISYSQKEFKSLFVNDDTEHWGFFAHELQDALLPSAAHGRKDSANEIQTPNLLTIVAALTRALQEAMVRIEELERVTAH